MILSAAMMVRLSLGLHDEAADGDAVIADGYRTPDIAGAGSTDLDTAGMGTMVAERL